MIEQQQKRQRIQVLVLHGPNLNLLGKREPGIYRALTLGEINSLLDELADGLNSELKIIQSNHEGVMVDALHEAMACMDGVLINGGAYSHTSVALQDALRAIGLPAVEVHLSNTYAREDFRHFSYLSSVCIGQVVGFGAQSYLLGLRGLVDHILRMASNEPV
jgi:3-dehydroquinate dehydratase-2